LVFSGNSITTNVIMNGTASVVVTTGALGMSVDAQCLFPAVPNKVFTVISLDAYGTAGAVLDSNPGISGSKTITIMNNRWTWPSQLVSGTDYGSPVVQCVQRGTTSGGAVPTWSTTLGGQVTYGTSIWATVGFN
jgi:hypothetical protein